MVKVKYLGPHESYSFIWKDGEQKRFVKDREAEVAEDVATYVLTQLNPRRLPLGREAHDSGAQVFVEVVDGKASRTKAATGGDS